MLEDKIKQLLSEELGVEISDIDGSTQLFSSGIVDSFSLVSIITFVEQESGNQVSPEDVNLDNLDSIDRIVSFVDTLKG